MEKTIENEQEFENTNENNLINSYTHMIKEHKKYLTNEIFKSIFKITNKIEKKHIEKLIDRYLSIELEYTGLGVIDKLTRQLNKEKEKISSKISDNPNKKDELFETYKEEIKKILKNNQMNWLSDTTEDFTKVLINELKNNLIYDKKMKKEDAIRIGKNIKDPINSIFKKYEKKFNRDYQNLLREYIENKLKEIKDNIFEIEDQQIKTNITEYYKIINLSNYELIEDSKKIYIKDKNSGEQYELFFKDNRLKTKDNKIIFDKNEKENIYGYINNIENKRIAVHNGIITLVLLNKEEEKTEQKKIISFTKHNHKYKFFDNSKKVEDIDEIEKIINLIKENAENIYQMIINDKDYIQIQNKIDNRKREKLIDDLINKIMNDSTELEEAITTSHSKRK